MRRPSRFTVLASLACAPVAAFVAAHDLPPDERLGAALLGVGGLAVLTTLVVALLRWSERRKERR